MSTPDEVRPERSVHVEAELAALLGGELDLDATRAVTTHLRGCADCRNELVETAAGIALMRRLDRAATLVADRPAPTRHAKPARSRSRAVVLVAAAVVLLFAGAVATATLLAGRGSSGPDATVAFAPVSGGTARGSVGMQAAGDAQTMAVDTSLGAAPPDTYYEVWLLDRSTGKMLPVGVLPPDGRGTYRLPGRILERYDTVDISRQADDGTTAHSDDSVLRADYA